MLKSDLRSFLDQAIEVVLIAREEFDVGPTRPWDQVHIAIHQSRQHVLTVELYLSRVAWNRDGSLRPHRNDPLVLDDDDTITNRCSTVAINYGRTCENHRLSLRCLREA